MKALFLKILYRLVHIDDTPERTAMAFSLGVFLSFSPFLGLHTILGILLAFALRLNRVAVMIGVYSNTPWTLVPFYAFATWFGVKLLGYSGGVYWPEVGLGELFRLHFWLDLARNWRLLIPTFVGSGILSLVLAAGAYPLSLALIRKYRERARPQRLEDTETR